MASDSLSQPTHSELTSPDLQKRAILVMICCVLAVGATWLYRVNNNDNDIHRRMALLFFTGEPMYFADDTINYVNLYPPHTALLITPFTILGKHWSAFWDLFIITVLLAGHSHTWAGFGTRAAFILSPFMIFVAAAANISGTTTGLGLLLLLSGRRGILRGVAWAFLLVRPQETLLILLLEAGLGLYHRDWKAFATTAVFLLVPVLIYSPTIYLQWPEQVRAFAQDATDQLGFADVQGVVPAVLFLGGVLLARLITLDAGRLRWRHIGEVPVSELYWFLIMCIFVMGPYTRLYALWHIFLPVRYTKYWGTLLIFVSTISIGLYYFTAWDFDRFSVGIVLTIAAVAVFASRTPAAPQARTLPALFASQEEITR